MKNLLVFLGTAVMLAGCASSSGSAGPPTIQTGPDAEITVDGLHRVDNSVMALGYMKPDMDLRGYTAIMLDPVTVAYQRDPGNRRTTQSAGGDRNFALTPTQMEDFKSLFQDAVVEALSGDGGYRIVDTPGPDVLRITTELLDLIVRVPTRQTGGRGTTSAQSFGVVTLVLEARDSQSGEILARAAERRDPTGNVDNRMVQVTPGIVRSNVRILFEYWAEILRERLDALREVEIVPDPAQ